MEGLERLLDRGLVVPAVDLVEVDVVGAEPSEARVDRAEDVLAGEAAVVRARTHRPVDLGGEDDRVAGGEVAERPPEHLLARAWW